jgi:hypothetical protein
MPFRMKIAGKPLGKINKKRRRTLTHQIKVEMKAPEIFPIGPGNAESMGKISDAYFNFCFS